MKTVSALRIRITSFRLLTAAVLLSSLLGVAPAAAAAPEKYASIVVDANTGKTLYGRNADARRYPASLTKMMTLYVLFEELQAKRLSLDSKLTVSAKAAAQAPSKLGLRAGSTIRVEDAILALTTKSANDVAMAIAENVAGSQSGFAARMNRSARAIGMNSSTFRNPNGLPDPGQMTTARDMARLGQALQDRFPTYYKYFGARSFTYKGVRIRNHNRLLGSVEGVDGIKTGYTRASGFNLVTNVRRDKRHIVAVVLGGKTAASRDADMRKLIVKHLPAGGKTDRTPEIIVADASTDEGTDAEDVAEIAGDVRVPRARPRTDRDLPALAYADASGSRDIVSAALAETAIEDELALEARETAAPNDFISARISTASAVAELADEDERGARSVVARLTRMAQVRAGKRDMVASAQPEVANAIGSAGDGWEIQIGAVPTQAGAKALLDKAQDRMGGVLASAEPVMQGVERNGATIYRARFSGFSDKDEARAACVKLKNKAFSCLAVPS